MTWHVLSIASTSYFFQRSELKCLMLYISISLEMYSWSLWRRNGQKLKNTTSRDEHQWFIMWQCSSDKIITPSYSTWIFCRGVSGFATDCPCDVWCRGLTTSLLNFGPPFGNRFSNTSWAVGLTYWIVYLHFSVFWHMQSYMSWYVISFFGFIFTS